MTEWMQEVRSSPTMVVSLSVVVVILSVVLLGFRKRSTAGAFSKHDPSQCAVLITGASRGIGLDLATTLANRGYTVFGTVRSESSYQKLLNQQKESQSDGTGKIHPIILDVTKPDDFPSAVESVKSKLSGQSQRDLRLIGIVNNAGINPEGDQWKSGNTPPMELSDPKMAEQVMDTNVLGTIRTTHAFLPLLADFKGDSEEDSIKESTGHFGRIVLIGSYFGSVAGAIGLPHVYYETSKHALEGLTDGLRRGLVQKKSKITVSLIKPGNIKTDMNDYGEVGPEDVSDTVIDALESNNPKHRYYPGKVKGMPSYVLCTIFEILPTWLTDRLL